MTSSLLTRWRALWCQAVVWTSTGESAVVRDALTVTDSAAPFCAGLLSIEDRCSAPPGRVVSRLIGNPVLNHK